MFDQFLCISNAEVGKMQTKWTENSSLSVITEYLKIEVTLVAMLGFSSLHNASIEYVLIEIKPYFECIYTHEAQA